MGLWEGINAHGDGWASPNADERCQSIQSGYVVPLRTCISVNEERYGTSGMVDLNDDAPFPATWNIVLCQCWHEKICSRIGTSTTRGVQGSLRLPGLVDRLHAP